MFKVKVSLSVKCTGALGSSACRVVAAAVVGCTGLLVEARTRDGARAITPDRPTAPNEGRNPVTPHWLAGEVMEPQVSVPMANGTMPAARADADPACHQPEHVPTGCPAPGAALLEGVLSDHKLEACVSQIPHAQQHAMLFSCVPQSSMLLQQGLHTWASAPGKVSTVRARVSADWGSADTQRQTSRAAAYLRKTQRRPPAGSRGSW